MDENHPSLDVQDRRFDKKDPAFDENHSELNDFISGPEDPMPDVEGFTSATGARDADGMIREKTRDSRLPGLPKTSRATTPW